MLKYYLYTNGIAYITEIPEKTLNYINNYYLKMILLILTANQLFNNS